MCIKTTSIKVKIHKKWEALELKARQQTTNTRPWKWGIIPYDTKTC